MRNSQRFQRHGVRNGVIVTGVRRLLALSAAGISATAALAPAVLPRSGRVDVPGREFVAGPQWWCPATRRSA